MFYEVYILVDNQNIKRNLLAYLKQYEQLNSTMLSITCFHHALDYLDALSNQLCDISIIDTHLFHQQGLSIAEEVKRRYPYHQVLIHSTDKTLAYQAFTIHVDGFISTTDPYVDFSQQWAHALCHMQTHKTPSMAHDSFTIKLHNGYIFLKQMEILSLEKQRNRLRLCTFDQTYYFYDTMKHMQERFIDNQTGGHFIMINQGCLINTHHVISVTGRTLTLRNQESFEISKTRLDAVIDALFHTQK